MFFYYILYVSAFIMCIQALPVEESAKIKTEFKGFVHLGSWQRNGPDGTFLESDYYLSEQASTWAYGAVSCLFGLNGMLFSIEDEAEDNFIRDLLFAEGLTGGVWSSGSYVEDEGGWVWAKVENEDEMFYPITYFNFKDSMPPNNSTFYKILPNGVPGNYGWSTAHHELSYRYICEINHIKYEK